MKGESKEKCIFVWISELARANFYEYCLKNYYVKGFFEHSKNQIEVLYQISTFLRTANPSEIDIAQSEKGILLGLGIGEFS